VDIRARALENRGAMRIPPFRLERFFSRWEFAARYMICGSDIEGYAMKALLDLADAETRALWDGLTLGYTETAGHPLLRAEIASTYEGISAEDVLVFSGAEEAIYVAMCILCEPGAHAVVTWPAYQSLFEVARATGADVTLVPLDRERGFAFDLGAIEKAIRPNTRVIVVNFPHNPTGALPTRAEMDALIALADDARITLFSDEVYRFLESDPSLRLPAAVERSTQAISLGVMSKAYALAGLRIGWIACRDRALIERLAEHKDYTSICNSAPSEILALIALRARDRVLARNREILARNLDHLDRFFGARASLFDWRRPRAGSVAFPCLRPRLGIDIDTFAAELVKEEGVLLLPGTHYDHPHDHFRVGFGRRSLPEAVERLEAFCARRFG
jgi:aspartate/methionine/tyrosine aminotransferase